MQAENWSFESGASLAPKSTFRAVIAAMPPPLPIALYLIVIPVAEPKAGIHCETSGNTNELPAPSSVVVARELDAREVPATAAPTTAVPSTTSASARLLVAIFRMTALPPVRGF